MIYKEFKDGIQLSRLGMGTMRLPILDKDNTKIDYEKATKLIDDCMKKGINYYDTAYIYHGGKSEEFLGKALAKYPRESYYITDKYNFQAEPDYRKQFKEQLLRLNVDTIDFYLLHSIQDAFADEMVGNGCIEYFDQMKKEGKIKYLGFSFHGSPKVMKKLLPLYSWDFVQIQLNYYDWYFEDAKELYEMLAEASIPVMVMEPVHGGLLANLTEDAVKELQKLNGKKSIASWAMRWVMDLDCVQVVLSGMSDQNQVDDNVKTFSEAIPLTEEEKGKIEKAAEIQHAAITIPCTACNYCTPNCPKGLDIPKLLKCYNEAKVGGAWRVRYLKNLPQAKGPSGCIGCKVCTKHCPQGFDIPNYMNELSEMLKNL
ncbi:aldo/keto reductase [Faecalimonas sp.]